LQLGRIDSFRIIPSSCTNHDTFIELGEYVGTLSGKLLKKAVVHRGTNQLDRSCRRTWKSNEIVDLNEPPRTDATTASAIRRDDFGAAHTTSTSRLVRATFGAKTPTKIAPQAR